LFLNLILTYCIYIYISEFEKYDGKLSKNKICQIGIGNLVKYSIKPNFFVS